VITNFNAGSTQTFPLWVYGAVKVGIPPQVFAMGTLIFTFGAIIAVVNVVANPPAGSLSVTGCGSINRQAVSKEAP
jgi:spermidine/putrescine transport system permease protein